MDTSYSVLLLDTKKDNPNHHLVLGLRAALKSNARVKQVVLCTYNDAIRTAQIQSFDLLLAVDGEGIAIDVLSRLKPLVGFSVLWSWEDPYERSRVVALASLFDFILTNDPGSVDHYPLGSKALTLAASIELPVRVNDNDYAFDIAFVGSAWPNRVLFLRRLLKARPQLKFSINLGYNPHIPKTYLDLPDSDYVHTPSHFDYLATFNQSRVNLTLHREFSGDRVIRQATSPGPRIFEAALAGAYQLVDAREVLIDDYFDPNLEVGVFRDFDECLTQIDEAIEFPERRIAKAIRSQNRARTEHTFASRVEELISYVDTALTHAPQRYSHPEQKIRPRILFVTHNTVAGGNFGGVEVYQETIAEHLRGSYDIFYYRPSSGPVNGHFRIYVLTDARHHILASFEIPVFDIYEILTQPQAEEAFSRVIEMQQIDLVHFHHLINHVPSLPLIAQLLGIPSVYTLQDFWTVCTRFNLIDHRGNYCNIAERPEAVCDVCLKYSEDRRPGTQIYRRHFFSSILSSFGRIMGNSPSAMRTCRSIYPDLADEVFVEVGLPLPRSQPKHVQPQRGGPADEQLFEPLRVVFLGNFTRIKGADPFLEAVALLTQENIIFTICGRIDKDYLQHIHQMQLPNLKVEGLFAPGELDLTRFDVSLHLSIWPETYCITLSEAWKAGVVPIVTDCGALGDRVDDGINGFKTPINGSGELFSLLKRLEADREELHRVRGRIGPTLWLTAAQHADKLIYVYSDLIRNQPQPSRPSSPKVETGSPITLTLSGKSPLAKNWTRPDEIGLPTLESSEPMHALWRELPSVRTAFENGCVLRSQNMQADLRRLGEIVRPVEGSWGKLVSWRPTQGAPQLEGWVSAPATLPSSLMLAIRGVNDILLRAVYLFDAEGIPLGKIGWVVAGFLSEPFEPEMLLDGCYSFELISKDGSSFSSTSLPAAVIVREGRAMLGLPLNGLSAGVPREVFEVESPVTIDRFPNMTGWLDELTITDLAPAGLEPVWALRCRGWLLEKDVWDCPASPCIRLRGQRIYEVPLKIKPRQDVLDALKLEQSSLNCGYDGGVWLVGLDAGRYHVEIVKTISGKLVVKLLAEITILDGAGHPQICIQGENYTRGGSDSETSELVV